MITLRNFLRDNPLVTIILALVSAWASWSTAAILRGEVQRTEIRLKVEHNRTYSESIQRDLTDIKKTVNTLLKLELEKRNRVSRQ